jgi:hypothetical protein
VNSLAEAKDRHAEVLSTARRIEDHFGHVRSQTALGATPRRVLATSSFVIHPADFGADPTGKADSTDSLKKAIAALLDTSKHGNSTPPMAASIVNFGGATLDLDAGVYLISAPLIIPTYVGNVKIVQGTLRASQSFPKDKWLLMIGSNTCIPKTSHGSPDMQASCNEFIHVSDIFFDSSHVAAGGVYVAHTMGATIGPSVFFIGFTDVGAKIDGGHEVMIQQGWFAEYYWSDATIPLPKNMSDSKSIGIQINGNDHFVTDVIVFAVTHVGVEVNAGCNILRGVHTWNFAKGVGIAVNAPQVRVLGCYLDFNRLAVKDPTQLVVSSNFFLETYTEFTPFLKHTIDGVSFRDNTYAAQVADPSDYPSIQLAGSFTGGTDVDITNEISIHLAPLLPGAKLKLTRARRSLHLTLAQRWEVDFADVLLLPHIEEISYSFVLDDEGTFVRHAARRPKGTVVVVETDQRVSGTVVVEVAQAVGGAPWPAPWSSVV